MPFDGRRNINSSQRLFQFIRATGGPRASVSKTVYDINGELINDKHVLHMSTEQSPRFTQFCLTGDDKMARGGQSMS